MNITNILYVATRAKWRKWLQSHHASEREIWLIYFKKHTGKPRIPYADAVEEALCFGWIDSLVKKLDEERFAQKFTPRKTNSKWSPSNIARVRRLMKEGRMTEFGLAVTDKTKFTRERESKSENQSKKIIVPSQLKSDLMENEKAWTNFNKLAPSYQRLYIRWITSVKKEETYLRRLKEAVDLLKENKKLGMK